ncbi:hypothetical protein [Archangium violaceum]|uniref:hypothetical protein n=1 Tax=Archangium violaceum TaxID=83451 RepID=UPI0037C0A69D
MAGARCIQHHIDTVRFVATAQVPNGGALQFESVGQLRHHGVRLRHGQQHARSARDALLGTSVLHQRLEVGHFPRRKVE